jgi:multiple sugar transport system substrate-binding protein
MSKTSWRWSILTTLMILSLILAACGAAATPAPAGEGGTGAAPTTAAVEPTTAATEPTTAADASSGTTSGEAVTLRWRTRPDNQAEIDVYQSISDLIDEEMTDLTLVYEPGGSEGSSYQDVLKTEIAAGTAPDVFWIPGTDIADFAKRGLILNLRDLASKTEGYSDEDFYPGPMAHLTFNPETSKSGEALWGLPRDVSTFVLYLNLDLIEEAGVDDPRELAKQGKWDWDAFLKTAQAIDELGDEIKGYGQNAWWGPYGYWVNAAGGNFFNEDRTACALNSKEALAGLSFESDLYNKYDVAVPYGQDSEPPFLAGTVGMFQNGRWATPGMRSSAKFKWDVVKLPDGPAGPSNWLFWGAYAVNAKTKHPEQAWALVQALTQADIQAKISELGANIPSRVSDEATKKFLTFTPPDTNEAFIQGLSENPQTEGPLWAGSWPDYDSVVGPEVSAVMTGEKPVEEFGNTICDLANKSFDTQ